MCSSKQMNSHLLSQGIRIQHHRICESMRRIDADGTLARCLHTIQCLHVIKALFIVLLDLVHCIILMDIN